MMCRGGKGGFGSLLRGSGKTAMTENEDACRDLSGRRLRLVNAEKNLQDWAAAEKQRREDKQAAKEERERVKADNRAEEAQVGLSVILCVPKYYLLLSHSQSAHHIDIVN